MGYRIARWKAQQGGTGWAVGLHARRHCMEARGELYVGLHAGRQSMRFGGGGRAPVLLPLQVSGARVSLTVRMKMEVEGAVHAFITQHADTEWYV